MEIRMLLAGSLCLIGSPAAAVEAAPGQTRDLPAASCPAQDQLRLFIEASLEQLIEEHAYPGFAYAVAGPDGPIVEGGVGVLNRDTGLEMRADTIFQVGSVSKMFTGALLAKLTAQDAIGLGDRLSSHWYPEDALAIDYDDEPLTLQHIATHTAGLPRYPDNLDREDGDPILGYSLASMRAALSALPPTDAPARAWSYSNFGYGVLAQAMARSQRTSFEALMQEAVISPVGLHDTGFALADGQAARLATPYRDDDITIETQPWQMETMSGAGGLFSTPHDLAKFGIWLMSKELDSAEARMLQRAPLVRQSPKQAYGLGMFIVDDYVEGIDVLWHGGDVDGYAGSLVLLPNHGIAIAYMTNIGFARGFADLQRGIIARSAQLCGDLGGHL